MDATRRVPTPDEQIRIALYLKTVVRAIDRVQESLARQEALLTEYRQALITAAVTGQLDEATLNGQRPISESMEMETSA